MNLTSFIPQEKFLHGPGPSPIHPNTLKAMTRCTIGHLDLDFTLFMEDVKTLLKSALETNNRLTFPVSGPGSVGMETCFVNLVEPGDRVVVCVNGIFGQRMVENVKRSGGIPLILEIAWGETIQPDLLKKFLQEQKKIGDIHIVAFVHAETSTGTLSDAETLCKIIHEFNALIIMDAVTSVAGVPVRMDAWGIDALYSGTQKCLSCPPGLSPVSVNERAFKKIQERKTTVQSWFMDLSLVQKYWDVGGQAARSYHHTPPIHLLYALHESLLLFHQEGKENVWQRHIDMASKLKSGLNHLGFEYLIPETVQMPQLHVVIPPKSIREQEAIARMRLLREHRIEVAGGLGMLSGKVWRIGLMGHGAREENVDRLLTCIKQILN